MIILQRGRPLQYLALIFRFGLERSILAWLFEFAFAGFGACGRNIGECLTAVPHLQYNIENLLVDGPRGRAKDVESSEDVINGS